MSATFTCPDAPTREISCEFCAWEQESTGDPSAKCMPDCKGTQRASEAPECNFSEGNTTDLCRLLGIGSEPYGMLPADKVPEALRAVIKALNVDQRRASLVCSPFTDVGAKGARLISAGNTDSQTVRRLAMLQKLFVYAADRGYEVHWG